MLRFDFVKEGLSVVSVSYFVCDFSRNIFLMLYSIKRSNFIVSLRLLLQICCNMCTVIVYDPFCDIINTKVYLSFLIKQFFYMNKYSEQKCKYLKNKNSFQGKIKTFFITFKLISAAKNGLKPNSAPLISKTSKKQIL